MNAKASRPAPAEAPLEQALSLLQTSIRSTVQEEVQQALERMGKKGSQGGGAAQDPVRALVERAPELFGSEEWKKELSRVMESAFQTVLPQLIKRFKSEIEQRVTGGAGGGASQSLTEIVNSSEMKEMLEDRFRHMLLYLKQDVLPRAIQQATASA